MSRPVDALIDFLRSEEARGITHVHLDEESRQVLRDLNARSKRPAGAAPVTASPTARVVSERPSISLAAAPAPKPSAATSELRIEGYTPAEQIDSLRRQAETWVPALSLGTLKSTMVFSVGNPEAEIMLVGEAPGYQEERQKEPFAGEAGQKLTAILKAMGLTRDQVYLTYLVKFRPDAKGQTSNTRQATAEEIESFLPFLRAEVSIVKPSCIIALGTAVSKTLLRSASDVRILHGKWHEFEGVPLRITSHPGHLLTSGNDDKRKVWEDMLAVMELLAMRISEKQRGYFSK